jgi:hypothetical protein
MWPTLDSTTYPWPRYPAIVLALDGDSTITSLVPWPFAGVALPRAAVVLLPLVALAVVAAFVFVVSVLVLAGTLFPSSICVVTALTLPVVTRRPTAETTGPVRCVPSGSPEYTADFTTAG